jgi:peptidyl-prolyl cis-trans isomerase B (cyclophilin B)
VDPPVPPRRSLAGHYAVLGALFGLALAGAGCGGGGDGKATAPNTVSKAAKGRCKRVAEPKPRRVHKRPAPTFRLSSGKDYVATIVTSCGTFEIELDSKHAPRTGGSFVTLARKHFYDGLSFHKIVPGFVIQGGDPRGDGTGGPGYTIREPPPPDVVYAEGVVAMAKTAVEPPGTSGSQFFVVTSDSSLPPEHALLGRVERGMDVVHRIEEIPAGPDERPVEPVVIEKVRVSVH